MYVCMNVSFTQVPFDAKKHLSNNSLVPFKNSSFATLIWYILHVAQATFENLNANRIFDAFFVKKSKISSKNFLFNVNNFVFMQKSKTPTITPKKKKKNVLFVVTKLRFAD